MTSALEILKARLGEPEVWGWARPRLWEASERYLGTALPPDYKEFMDLYGPGSISGFLDLDRPMTGDDDEAERLWSNGAGRSANPKAPGACPYRFWPDRQGLIRWGHDQHGSVCYFWPTDPAPADWAIVVQSECGEWHESFGPFTAFMLSCFDGLGRPSFMDRSWPGPDPRYESYA